MNRYTRQFLYSKYWLMIVGLSILLSGAGLYLFKTSAKADDPKEPVEQNIVNGRLAFNHNVAGPGPERSIITANADGSGAGTLVSTGGHWPFNPAWSPDGTKIAYTSTGISNIGEIWSVNITGGEPTNLTNTGSSITEDHAAWSVTGKIAYERGGQIWTMNADGTEQAQFTAITQPSPTRPAWSPDGLKLAFVSNNDIWVINANGTNQVQLTITASADGDPSWSPDGTKIVFRKGGVIAVINANGTNEAPLTAGPSDREPAWSPDGTKIAYRGTSGVWIMDAGGTNQVRIYTDIINFPLCCDHHYENPAWQPVAQAPNTYIINGRLTDNNNVGLIGATVNLSGTTNASTTTDNVGNYSFSGLAPGGTYTLSPSALNRFFTPTNRVFTNLDSNKVASFTSSRVCVGLVCAQNGKIAFFRNGEIFTVNPDGSGSLNVTNNAATDTSPDWSPDGSQIVFQTNRDGNTEIYRMNSETDVNPTRLTNNSATDGSPRYSPNGQSIVFTTNRDGNNEIYTMNADGSNQVRLTNDTAFDSSPSFSPDGGKILWVRQVGSPSFSLWTMNADGTNQELLFGPANFITSPSYSPDGTMIIMVYGVDITQQTIYVMSSTGANLTQAGFGRSQPAWSPDGTKVVHNCCFFQGPQFQNGLFISNVGTSGLQQRLTSQDDGAPDWQPRRVPRRTPFDFDADERSDLSFFRPSNSGWYLLRSGHEGLWVPVWGLATDTLVPGDYDGDLKTDVAVWRESDQNFYVLNSFDFSVRVENFGLAGDIPTGGDFDGDGKTEVAVYRPGSQGVFYYRASMGNPQRNTTFVPWGISGDKPVVGDYDADGRTDVAVYRPSNGTWYVVNSSNGQPTGVNFGISTDKLIPADYDGDGKTDFAVFRDGTWYLLQSIRGFSAFQFGIAGDIPVPADYDGDGKADPTIFRNGVWWSMRSKSGGIEAHEFGTATDKPLPAVFVR